jgi:hypothetical protein
VYIKYDPSVFYKEFLYKTFLNANFWYVMVHEAITLHIVCD